MNRTMRRFSVHTLTKETHVFHFLSNESTGNANFFTSNKNDLLTIEKLLCYNGCKAAEHVVTSIDHDSLCADSRSGHHFCYFFSRGKFRVLVRTKIIREEEKVCNVIIGLFLIWCKPNINFFLSYILPTCIFFFL
jgi:hypothetical protein